MFDMAPNWPVHSDSRPATHTDIRPMTPAPTPIITLHHCTTLEMGHFSQDCRRMGQQQCLQPQGILKKTQKFVLTKRSDHRL